jgi:hypothetical protein
MPTPNPPHDPDVDLWDCACRECTALEHEPITLVAFRAQEFPEHWGRP